MNAHSPRRPVAAQVLSPHLCPVEAIGRRLAEVGARISELDQPGLGDNDDRRHITAEIAQLWDLRERLDLEMEWTEPQSLAGVFVLLVQLGVIAEEMAEDDDARVALRTRFARLHHLAVEGLARVAGLEDLRAGLSMKLCAQTSFMAALKLAS
jgi:hypothetical protein